MSQYMYFLSPFTPCFLPHDYCSPKVKCIVVCDLVWWSANLLSHQNKYQTIPHAYIEHDVIDVYPIRKVTSLDDC